MCLAVPGEIVEMVDDRGMTMATVDFGGARRSVCCACVPEAVVGDHVLVHAGFALTIIDAAAAAEARQLWAEMLPDGPTSTSAGDGS